MHASRNNEQERRIITEKPREKIKTSRERAKVRDNLQLVIGPMQVSFIKRPANQCGKLISRSKSSTYLTGKYYERRRHSYPRIRNLQFSFLRSPLFQTSAILSYTRK